MVPEPEQHEDEYEYIYEYVDDEGESIDAFIVHDLKAGRRRLDIAMELARSGRLTQEEAVTRVVQIDQQLNRPIHDKPSRLDGTSWLLIACGVLIIAWSLGWVIWLWLQGQIHLGPVFSGIVGSLTMGTGFWRPQVITKHPSRRR